MILSLPGLKQILHFKNNNIMAKAKDIKEKTVKKEPQKTLKEKRAAKAAKRKEKS